MYLHLSTTRTDGGWMYFQINNDDYMQLSGSDSKVTIYRDTTIHVNINAVQANFTSADTNILPLVLTRDVNNWFLG